MTSNLYSSTHLTILPITKPVHVQPMLIQSLCLDRTQRNLLPPEISSLDSLFCCKVAIEYVVLHPFINTIMFFYLLCVAYSPCLCSCSTTNTPTPLRNMNIMYNAWYLITTHVQQETTRSYYSIQQVPCFAACIQSLL